MTHAALPMIGVDLVENSRIRRILERGDDAFVRRVFTEKERAYCDAMADPVPHYAARFAAKEAVAKAFGTGIGAHAAFIEIEVDRQTSGQPMILLHGSAAETARNLHVSIIRVSLSHTADHATAMVLLG